MRNPLEGAGHLTRIVLLLVAGVLVFFVLRSAVVPKEFGKYGHFRPGALDDIRARPIKFAGREACEACHSEVAEKKSKGRHAGVGCEACHGALARHAEDPSSVVPQRPNVATLCVRCHEANAAKPKTFPQVVSADHAGDIACNTCHAPHSPKLGDQP